MKSLDQGGAVYRVTWGLSPLRSPTAARRLLCSRRGRGSQYQVLGQKSTHGPALFRPCHTAGQSIDGNCIEPIMGQASASTAAASAGPAAHDGDGKPDTRVLWLDLKRTCSMKPTDTQRTNELRSTASASHVPLRTDFDVVIGLIEAARTKAVAAVNTTLIDLYWNIGEHISKKTAQDGWGKGTVESLSEAIQRRYPGATGYSAANLWRMRQFYQTYHGQPKLATLLRELAWSHNLLILSRCKREEEREFYLRLAGREHWPYRELQRQLSGGLFERTVLSPAKLSPAVTELYPDAPSVFKDSYLLEFLDLPASHGEADLQRGLVEKLKQFLIELGRDFCFIRSQYPVQVGGRDFAIDLLFFHRGLNCLVAIELKIDEFQPEYLGKLEFYLESLDRDVKKPHEQPSIGLLLCATKDHEVVEYALSRTVSPALVAEYETKLPDKKLLQAKLHEFYRLAEERMEGE
jgi:predicted nuclease of restriction endonuclease-like (RecB) superfamily